MDGSPNGGVFSPQNLNLFSYTYNNPVNLVDPDGNWVNVAIGALVGLVAQGVSDLCHGELSGWKSYGTAIVAGGVAGATFGAGAAALGAAGAGESVVGGYAVAATAGATGGSTARAMNGEEVTAGTVAFDATVGMALHGVVRGVGSKLKSKTAAKPYSNSRPSYRKGLVGKVWENAKNRNGKVIDPTGKEIIWNGSKPRSGQWDMGHVPGKEYWRLHEEYMNGKISKEEFLNEYNNPNNYRPELVKTNRGRQYEQK